MLGRARGNNMKYPNTSVLEYTAGSSLQASSWKIPFYTLLMSANKPSHKNKSQQHIEAFVLCDIGASISLAPVSIAQQLGMRIDRTELISVSWAVSKKIKVVGTSYIYMRDKVSPSWRRVKVVVTESGDNFLLSCSDLKNLDLMSKDFPEYIGQRRGAHASSVLAIGEIIDEAMNNLVVTEEGCCITLNNEEEHEQT